jgi:hypothetical protein
VFFILHLQVHYLGAIGGKDIADTTRRIMRQHVVVTSSVARRTEVSLDVRSKTGICEVKILDVGDRYDSRS